MAEDLTPEAMLRMAAQFELAARHAQFEAAQLDLETAKLLNEAATLERDAAQKRAEATDAALSGFARSGN